MPLATLSPLYQPLIDYMDDPLPYSLTDLTMGPNNLLESFEGSKGSPH